MRYQNLELSDVRVYEETEAETARRHLLYDYFAEWIVSGEKADALRAIGLFNRHYSEGDFD